MSHWQPIDTAPKGEDNDGPTILVYWAPSVEGGIDYMDVACWCNGRWTDPEDIETEYGDPDYWMPLPSAPTVNPAPAVVWIYDDTYARRPRVFASEEAANRWFEQNDPEGVAFECKVEE